MQLETVLQIGRREVSHGWARGKEEEKEQVLVHSERQTHQGRRANRTHCEGTG